ncbi:hypothetical protein FOZ62_007244, partial [Perkinsus olseni]
DTLLLAKALDSVVTLFDEEALNKTTDAMKRTAARGVYRRVNHAPHCDLGPDSGEIVTPLQQSIRQYFPGGISSASTTSPLFKELQTLIANFQGSDAAQRQASQLISATSATMAKHIGEAAVASLLSAVPSSVPPLASDISVVAIGKVPLCSTLCHNVLAQCPGFNLDDVSGPCDSSSVPPVCAMAHFSRVDDMPPQYSTFDEHEPFSDKCPPFDPTLVFAGDHSLLEAVRRAQ